MENWKIGSFKPLQQQNPVLKAFILQWKCHWCWSVFNYCCVSQSWHVISHATWCGWAKWLIALFVKMWMKQHTTKHCFLLYGWKVYCMVGARPDEIELAEFEQNYTIDKCTTQWTIPVVGSSVGLQDRRTAAARESCLWPLLLLLQEKLGQSLVTLRPCPSFFCLFLSLYCCLTSIVWAKLWHASKKWFN